MDIIFRILHQKLLWKNASLYLKTSWATTLEMCITLLWEISLYYYTSSVEKQMQQVQQYIFMFTAMYHVLMFMAYENIKNKKYGLCDPLILFL